MLGTKIFQFFIGLFLIIKNKILLFPLTRLTFDLRNIVFEIIKANVNSLIFFAQNNHHDIAYS